ncbi:hypothetical protein PSECIP111951_01958 [Pseudoalteromonas holothuriae]|uniref:Metallo-beta-lactamase domain-containing protein n=1 Tax=Pseudoalteromonas holothuriae TaxID=2963714 RepID=A0ABN8UPS7_9GAMM|nr:hypothetical protein [Pseudoalteromonas sp. CIP111951]CAH9058867.1 hypothetical protein PSECIP111951_01958 [Pseudoalteromonas sp. CIP111951]
MRLIFAAALCLLTSITYANQWHNVDDTTWLVSPPKVARYIQANQAIIIGKRCAAIINAHGNFVALEKMINTAKRKLQVPVCYLLSPSAEAHQITGMAMLQRAFPSAKWYAGETVADNLVLYQQALTQQLSLHEKSISLSTKRLSLSKQDNPQLKAHIEIAKQRLADWQNLSLQAPSVLPPNTQHMLQLGENKLILNTKRAFSTGDVFIFNPINGALLAGNSVDILPDVRHERLSTWLNQLKNLQTDNRINWLLPSYGKPYKKEALSQPITFLLALTQGLDVTEAKQYFMTHYHNLDDDEQARLLNYYQLAQRRLSASTKNQNDVLH